MDHHLTNMLTGGELVITAWHDPLAARGFPADSDDTLVTGRDAIFDSCQCLAGGAR